VFYFIVLKQKHVLKTFVLKQAHISMHLASKLLATGALASCRIVLQLPTLVNHQWHFWLDSVAKKTIRMSARFDGCWVVFL